MKRFILTNALLIIIFIIFFTISVLAHPGSKNDYGCHICHTNCDDWGYEYNEEHCHEDSVPKYNFPSNDKISYAYDPNSSKSVEKENKNESASKLAMNKAIITLLIPSIIGTFASILYLIFLNKKSKK